MQLVLRLTESPRLAHCLMHFQRQRLRGALGGVGPVA